MVFIPREEAFTCDNCGAHVEPLGEGTYRDHCPKCLYSKHVDKTGPGDRASDCKGTLKPYGIDSTGKKGFIILYECLNCGKLSRNRAAEDDEIILFLAKMKEEGMK